MIIKLLKGQFLEKTKNKKKIRKQLRYISYNSGQNILELHNILVKIRFTTSKMKLDI